MKSNNNFSYIHRVADALGVSVDSLVNNKKLCTVMTDLFDDSPDIRRQSPVMLDARAQLLKDLAETLHRDEIENYLCANPEYAKRLLEKLAMAQEDIEYTKSYCKRALAQRRQSLNDY